VFLAVWISRRPRWILARPVRGSGDTLGRYTLRRRLAGGGMGEVFLASTRGSGGVGSRVALKVLRSELVNDASFVHMIIDEARISMFLNHQNIVSVLDFAQDGGDYYLAMEYVQGTTVEQLLEEMRRCQRRPDIPIAVYIAGELCRALKYAHACVDHKGQPLNIIHRDVTPANILLSIHGDVKLTDFGIARAIGRVHQTQAGMVKGKFGYLAPEMTRNEAIDSRADLFSYGVVFYHLLTGQHPIPNASIMEAIFRFEEREFPPPSAVNREVPPPLDAIVMRALEPRPDLRWASAQELGDALRDAVMSIPALRRSVQHGAQSLAVLLRDLMPYVFDDPLREIVDGPTTPRSMPTELDEDTLKPKSKDPFGYAHAATRLIRSEPSPPGEIPDLRRGPFSENTVADNRAIQAPSVRRGPKPTSGSISALEDPAPRELKTLEEIPSINQVRFLDSSTSPETAFQEEPTSAADELFAAKTGPHERGFGLDLASSPGFGEKTTTDVPRLDPQHALADSPFDRSPYEDLPALEAVLFQQDSPGSTSPFIEATEIDSSRAAGIDKLPTVQMSAEDSESEGTDVGPIPIHVEVDLAEPTLAVPASMIAAVVEGARATRDDRIIDDESGFEPTRLRPRPEEGVPATVLSAPVLSNLATNSADLADGFGSKTDKWIQGEPEPIPRDLAVRNAPKQPARSQPRPSGGGGGARAFQTAPPFSSAPAPHELPILAIGPRGPIVPGPIAPQAGSPEAPAVTARGETVTLGMDHVVAERARSRATLIACVLIAVAVGTIAGVFTYPRILKPTLRLGTDPSGARVRINGAALVKSTPVTIDVSPHQRQRVEIELDGYRSEVREVAGLDRGQTYQLNVELQAMTSSKTP
jgi:serine/threonine protein kinase